MATQDFFVIKSCDYLEAPAIFLSKKDYNFFLEENENSSVNMDCKVFQDIVLAFNYMLPGALNLQQKQMISANKNNYAMHVQKHHKATQIDINGGENENRESLNSKNQRNLIVIDVDSKTTRFQQPSPGDAKAIAAQASAIAKAVLAPPSEIKSHLSTGEYFEKCFEHNFNVLKEYKKAFHTIDIPLKHESVRQGKFLGLDQTVLNFRNQIQIFNLDQSKSELTFAQVQRLIDLGLLLHRSSRRVEDRRETRFQEKFSLLKEYKNKFSTIYIPSNHTSTEEGSGFEGLYRWLSEMRRQMKLFRTKPDESILTESQIERLIEIGFESSLSEQRNVLKFDRMLQLLSEYKDKYNTCYIPMKHENVAKGTGFETLDVWCSRIRTQMKLSEEKSGESSLTEDQVQRLKDLDFVKNVSTGPNAGIDQELKYERKKKQFVEGFEERFNTLLAFKEKNGHTNVPYRTGGTLIFWVKVVRQEYAKMKSGEKTMLSTSMVTKLLGSGFELNLKQTAKFETRALEWLEFCQKVGRHPKKGTEDEAEESLARWVGRMRGHYHDKQAGKTTVLEQRQIDQLNQWGFKWSGGIKKPTVRAKKKSWIQRYKELLEYKEIHGDTVVPQHYPELGAWVKGQRKEYQCLIQGRKSSLTEDQLEKLKSVGFVWKVRGNSQKRNSSSNKNTSSSKNDNSNKRAKIDLVQHTEVDNNDNYVPTDDEDECIDFSSHHDFLSANKAEPRQYTAYQQMAQHQATAAMYATNYGQHWNTNSSSYL